MGMWFTAKRKNEERVGGCVLAAGIQNVENNWYFVIAQLYELNILMNSYIFSLSQFFVWITAKYFKNCNKLMKFLADQIGLTVIIQRVLLQHFLFVYFKIEYNIPNSIKKINYIMMYSLDLIDVNKFICKHLHLCLETFAMYTHSI